MTIRPARLSLRAAPAIALGLLACNLAMASQPPAEPTAEALRQANIRRLESKHLTLHTDLPSTPAVDRLPAEFDLAYPGWCEYFGLPAEQDPPWRVTAYLMRDPQRFRALDMLTDEVPKFEHGYTINDRCWLNEQPSDYYRRHLLLHEGTHAFMLTRLGNCGPTWYMEGIAEYLSTHLRTGDQLTIRHFPRTRDEVPYWGRIKIIADTLASGKALPLATLMELGPREFGDRLGYAWSWAAAAFLDGHPRYRDRFRTLPQIVREPGFNRRARDLFGDDWPALCAEFELFLHDLEYGYDLQRTALDWRKGQKLKPAGATVAIRADQGWQNTGMLLDANQAYALRAQGRYVIAADPASWPCEAGGVTLRYYHGRPLGELLAAVVPAPAKALKKSPWDEIFPIGLGATIRPVRAGTLFLRVNDSAAELADNQGELTVEIRPDGGSAAAEAARAD